MVYRIDYDFPPSVPRYEAYRRLTTQISNSKTELGYVKKASLVSHKLVEIYLELCTICTPLGFVPFLKPKLESVCGSHRNIPPHLDIEVWRMAVLELAICDIKGKLRLVVLLKKVRSELVRALSELNIATWQLGGTQNPKDEALLLVEKAKSNTTFFSWGLSAPQFRAMLEINQKLIYGDKKAGEELPLSAGLSKPFDPTFEAAAHEVRTKRWFITHEVPLSVLVKPTEKVKNAHVVEFFKTASVDAVVYLTTPFVEPVLAIEFDGADFHDRPESMARDNLKEALLSQVGIPLLRIKGSDPDIDSALSPEKRYADFAAQLYVIRDLVHGYVSALWQLRMQEKCDSDNVPYPAEISRKTYCDPKAVLKTEMRKIGLDDNILVSYNIWEIDGFRYPNALVRTHKGENHLMMYAARCSCSVISQRYFDQITLVVCAVDLAVEIKKFILDAPPTKMPEFN